MRTLNPFLFALTTLALSACGGGAASNMPVTPIALSNFTGDWVSCTPISAQAWNLGTGDRGLRIELHIGQQDQRLQELRSARIFSASNCTGEQVLTTEDAIPLPNKYLGHTSTTFYETIGAIQIAGATFNQTKLLDQMEEPLSMQALLGLIQGKLHIKTMSQGAAWDSPVEAEIYERAQ